MRDPEGVGVPVEVEAGHGGEADPLVEHGPRLAGEDLDAVAELHQLTGQVAGVDALAAAAGVAPVHQVGDPQAAGLGRRGGAGRGGTSMWRLRSHDPRISATRWPGPFTAYWSPRCDDHGRSASPGSSPGRKRPGGGPLGGTTAPRTVARGAVH